MILMEKTDSNAQTKMQYINDLTKTYQIYQFNQS